MMMQKYFSDISEASKAKVYEFDIENHKMVLSIVKCEFEQCYPANNGSGFFSIASPAHTEMVTGFIGGLLVDGKETDGFRISGSEDGDILETSICGKYHAFKLSEEIASTLAKDKNIHARTSNWDAWATL